jgi:hypothetical protein
LHPPRIQINFRDVAQYIAAISNRAISKEDLSEILDGCIKYAPASLVNKLMGESEQDQDMECIIAVARLLVNGFIPPIELCPSILGIFLEKDGPELTNEILQSQTVDADCFAQNLGRLSDNVE